MMIEIGFIALLLAALKKAGKQGAMTPEREEMFHEAMANIRGPKAPELFLKLADGFAKYGFPLHANILRERAKYLSVSPEKKAERDAIIAKAMQSTRVDAIDSLANLFEKQTATGIARDLRAHAKAVREGTFVPKQDKSNGHIETQKPDTTKEAAPS